MLPKDITHVINTLCKKIINRGLTTPKEKWPQKISKEVSLPKKTHQKRLQDSDRIPTESPSTSSSAWSPRRWKWWWSPNSSPRSHGPLLHLKARGAWGANQRLREHPSLNVLMLVGEHYVLLCFRLKKKWSWGGKQIAADLAAKSSALASAWRPQQANKNRIVLAIFISPHLPNGSKRSFFAGGFWTHRHAYRHRQGAGRHLSQLCSKSVHRSQKGGILGVGKSEAPRHHLPTTGF